MSSHSIEADKDFADAYSSGWNLNVRVFNDHFVLNTGSLHLISNSGQVLRSYKLEEQHALFDTQELEAIGKDHFVTKRTGSVTTFYVFNTKLDLVQKFSYPMMSRLGSTATDDGFLFYLDDDKAAPSVRKTYQYHLMSNKTEEIQVLPQGYDSYATAVFNTSGDVFGVPVFKAHSYDRGLYLYDNKTRKGEVLSIPTNTYITECENNCLFVIPDRGRVFFVER